MRQRLPHPPHTCVSIHQHTSAYVSIRQHTQPHNAPAPAAPSAQPHTCVSIRQHSSAFVSIRQHTSAFVSIRQHTSAYLPHPPRSRILRHPKKRLLNIPPLHPPPPLRPPHPPRFPIRRQRLLVFAVPARMRQHTSAYVCIRLHTAVSWYLPYLCACVAV
jgi:hypothetical protein